MTNDIQKQKPFTVSQIETEKPNAPRTKSLLSGYIGGSMNGGHNKVIAWKKVMAGEKHYEYVMKLNMQMLTPLTPAYQKLKCTIRTYFVPNSRVWKNAEKYTAQKGGAAEIKISEIPNTKGKQIPALLNQDDEGFNRTNTTIWRDSFISSYIPRLGEYNTTSGMIGDVYLPAMSILPLRGRIAIYNDYERNKEYDPELEEYDTDTVSNQEWNSYLPINEEQMSYLTMRAKREDNYYTNYRTEIQGFEESYPPSNMSADESLLRWASWESKIAEARAQANNAQKNDWDIIAEIRGSQKLSEGKVQLLGKKTFDVNYSAITQNTYNTNNAVQPEFQVMGKQGAYSYTEVQIPLYAAMEFKEEGYIHVIATVSADSVFESGIDRNLLNITPLDEYRPDMQGDKFDVLYEIECNGERDNMQEYKGSILGFKRKYSELFKLPNVIQGDMTTNDIIRVSCDVDDGFSFSESKIITNKTYQFFETSRNWIIEEEDGIYITKKIWKDYTDVLINKNQAIMNYLEGEFSTEIEVKGQNQIFFVGVCSLICDLPVNEEIKKDYTTWGEH